MKRETIVRNEAAEILGCNVTLVWQYIDKGTLSRAPKEADGLERVYLDEVLTLKEKRIARKNRLAEKKQKAKKRTKQIYNCSVYNPFDVMAVLDPEDNSGLTHIWFISRKAFDGLMTGSLEWDRIPVDEIYQECVYGRLPTAKYHD